MFSFWQSDRGWMDDFSIGERIRIRRGALAGLVGVVAGHTSDRRYLLDLDGVSDGVTVIVTEDAIEREGTRLRLSEN